MINLSAARVLAIIAAAWGFGVLLGGPDRFNSTSFEIQRGFAPWWFWGVFLLGYALLLAATDRWKYHWAVMLGGGVPYAFVVVGYWYGALGSETISLVGACVYTAIWMIYVTYGASLFMAQFVETNWYRERVSRF